MRTVFDSIAEGVVVANEEGRLILFNPAATQLSGIGIVEDPPEAWSARYGVFGVDRVTPMPTEALPMVRAMHGEAVDDELVFVQNPQQPKGRFLNVSGRPLHDSDGGFSGAAVVFRDVTEAREKEEAIRRLNQELADRVEELSAVNQELEAFTYSVSHDLRAPVRHILGFIDLLQARLGGQADDGAARQLTMITESARQMGALIDDLLQFSRTSRADMHETTVDLGAIVAEAQSEVSREAGSRSIEWYIGALPPVRGDRAMLRLVLVNLLSNAVKYTRPRGHARIDVTAQPGESGQVVIAIRDNGVGFDMQYADKLFGVFQRLHRPDEFEGTGIGLATVRRIVHRHGGRTWAEAAPDVGATFYLSLPVTTTTE